MKRIKKKVKSLLIRLKIAYNIIFKHKHGACLYVSQEQLIQVIENNRFESTIDAAYFGLMEHQFAQIIIEAASRFDPIEIALSKASFEAKFVENSEKKKNAK